MNENQKYVQTDIDELNEKLKQLNILTGNTFAEIQNGITGLDLSKISAITDWIKQFTEDSTIPVSINRLAKEISETITVLNYDINNLKSNLILSDDEIKTKYQSLSQIVQLGNNSIRERILLNEKLKSLEEELNQYTLKETPFNNMGYTGKLSVNSSPVENVPIYDNVQNNNFGFTNNDIVEKSVRRGYILAGYSFASSITASIIPLEKVNSLAQNLLKTFTEVVLKSIIIRTLFSGFDSVIGGELPLLGGGLFGNNSALPAIYSNKVLPNNKAIYGSSNSIDVNLIMPKVEFKQTGYDLKAVINKVEKSMDRYK